MHRSRMDAIAQSSTRLTPDLAVIPEYRTRDVALDGGTLHVGLWGPDHGVPVLAIHGITASHRAWSVVARLLPGHRLVVPDLRGRGRSNRLSGPGGMATHARDAVAVLDAMGIERAIVAGHSMGGFVALALADQHPQRVERLVLVDGGLPLARPDDVSIDEAIRVTLGPALARLTMTFPDRGAYHDFWRQHPSLGPYWSADIEAYVDYDLEPVPGPKGAAWRSTVRPALVTDDSRDLHDPAVLNRLDHLTRQAMFLRAPRGLLDEAGGMYADGVLEEWVERVPLLSGRTVPDVNHYTLLFAPQGAAAVASAIRG